MLVLEGLDPQSNHGKLSTSTGLANKAGFGFGGGGNSLTVGDQGIAHPDRDFQVLPELAVQDLQM